jgi:hypothetical protein
MLCDVHALHSYTAVEGYLLKHLRVATPRKTEMHTCRSTCHSYLCTLQCYAGAVLTGHRAWTAGLGLQVYGGSVTGDDPPMLLMEGDFVLRHCVIDTVISKPVG